MDNTGKNSIDSFEKEFSTFHLQVLKIISSHLPNEIKYKLALYIKVKELNIVISKIKRPYNSESNHTIEELDISSLLDEIYCICDNQEKTKIDNLRNTFNQLNHMQEMMETINAFKDFMPDDMNFEDLFNTYFNNGE